jgi:fatty acid desaturase
MNKTSLTALRDPDSLWPMVGALAYIASTYVGGWALLLQGWGWPWWVGVLMTAHGMVIAAFLMHDCAHNAIFTNNDTNTKLGRLLNAICGTNYGTYEDLRNKHFRHHVDNCDTVYLDYRQPLKQRPWLLRGVKAMEWCYIPAVEIIMHGTQVILPFMLPPKRDQRARVVRVALVRGGLLAAAGILQPWALSGYVMAYLMFMTVLRFMDVFQHDYQLYYRLADPSFEPPHKGDKVYEQTHTYTNLFSAHRPWLNLLTLNFSYHNAHHVRPTVGWFKLPSLSAELGLTDNAQRIGLRPQLTSFHRQRVSRVLSEDYGAEDLRAQLAKGQAVGVNAVSFLTAF